MDIFTDLKPHQKKYRFGFRDSYLGLLSVNTWASGESQEWSNLLVQWICVYEREERERERRKLRSILEMLV